MKVTILGTGYVGLSTGVCLAYIGHNVTCVDTDAAKVESLRAGQTPIFEPHLEALMEAASPRLKYTTSYDEAVPGSDVIFLAVGTPPLPTGAPDLQYLRAAARSLGALLDGRFCVIVNKSTVPVGSGNWVDSIVRDASPEGDFCIASNPEFLREGSALHDSLYPDRIVIGADTPRGIDLLYQLYRPILDQSFPPPPFLPRPEDLTSVPLVTTDLPSAELIKYAANAFLALKISYINEIGHLAARVGANVQHVARGIGLDKRIGPRFLNAGIGWGGSCFGKDTSALISSAEEYGLTMPIVKAARDTNYRQRELIVEQLLSALKILKGRTVGLLGLAFKPDTDDLRDAPALDIARRLIERGARVRAHDPVAISNARHQNPGSEIQWSDSVEALAAGADALVLVTEWEQYRDLDWAALRASMKHPLLIDGRFFLDGARVSEAGFQYLTLV
ncbi:MAG: UDP-glucose/GDP-mannose dehydrogenase family protein [Bryobacteraceae bacterium]|nr:UDP-glucose/GDP-mannose dehydrogenase family protein [Bryobacteraceae bacterium]